MMMNQIPKPFFCASARRQPDKENNLKQSQVPNNSSSFYSQWRGTHAGWILRESAKPSERLLQAVWSHQRLDRNQLRLVDGRTLRVLHPGFLNRESGPDFRRAIVQFENDLPVTGDIEIDLEPSGWHSHGHANNSMYAGVILHIVWRGAPSNTLPTLTLAGSLDAPIEELACWLGGDTPPPSANLLGRCNAPLSDLPSERIEDLLRQAAMIRLSAKAHQFTACARRAGWEQSLWEGLFRALGYKNNIWPMQRLADLLPVLRELPLTLVQWRARLLGLAGLLPAETLRSPFLSDVSLRQLWEDWWRIRASICDQILPRTIWRMAGLRPANHPIRRLTLAAHWLAQSEFIARLDEWLLLAAKDSSPANSLLRLLQSDENPNDTSQLSKPMQLLGASRATDLAVNVILPWFWARAGSGQNKSLQLQVEELFLAWPAGEDNAVLKLTRQRLFAGPRRLRSAAEQQGLLQIARDYCDHSNALCEHCPFPDLVRSWAATPSGCN